LESSALKRLCEAKDALLEAKEAEKQQLEAVIEQRLREMEISHEDLSESGKSESEVRCTVLNYLLQFLCISAMYENVNPCTLLSFAA